MAIKASRGDVRVNRVQSSGYTRGGASFVNN